MINETGTARFWLDRFAPEKRSERLISAEEICRRNRAAFQRASCEMHDIFGRIAQKDGGLEKERAKAALEKEKDKAQKYLKDMFQLPVIAEAFSGRKQAIENAVYHAEALKQEGTDFFVRGIASGLVPVMFLAAETEERIDELYLTELLPGEPFIVFFRSLGKVYLWIQNSCVEGWIRADQAELFDSEEQWREAAAEWHRRRPPLTPENLLKELFRNYGAGYRFGSRTDCTGYVRTVYERFGFLLPSNSVKQVFYPGRKVDLEGIPEEEKIRILKGLPLGAVLYMPMHAMVWLGEAGGSMYIINAVSSFYDAEGRMHGPRRIMVNSLDVRRKNGETWLNSLTAALIPWEKE